MAARAHRRSACPLDNGVTAASDDIPAIRLREKASVGADKAIPRNENVANGHAVLLALGRDAAGAEQKIREAIDWGHDTSHFHHAEYNIASAYAILGKKQ
jgi:hypothetical protein